MSLSRTSDMLLTHPNGWFFVFHLSFLVAFPISESFLISYGSSKRACIDLFCVNLTCLEIGYLFFLWITANGWCVLLTVDVVLGGRSSGETEASRKQADSMRAQSIRVCILSRCMEENMEAQDDFSFVTKMEIGIRRKATMTEMVNDDEETSSSVIIYLFI